MSPTTPTHPPGSVVVEMSGLDTSDSQAGAGGGGGRGLVSPTITICEPPGGRGPSSTKLHEDSGGGGGGGDGEGAAAPSTGAPQIGASRFLPPMKLKVFSGDKRKEDSGDDDPSEASPLLTGYNAHGLLKCVTRLFSVARGSSYW